MNELEPSDAQIKAALDAFVEGDFLTLYPDSMRSWVPKMRRAIRAAAIEKSNWRT